MIGENGKMVRNVITYGCILTVLPSFTKNFKEKKRVKKEGSIQTLSVHVRPDRTF